MEHVAIDLGGRESQVCVRAAEGQILLERKLPTRDLESFLRHQPHSRVVLETCAEAFRVADFALSCEHEVRVVPATLVRSLGVGARRIKTDRRDAQVLSEVSCRIDLPSVHIPTDLARERRSICGMREELLSSRTALINCVRGWARTKLLKIRSGDMMTFPKRARDAALDTADGLPEHVDRLLQTIEALNERIAPADKELEKLAQQDSVCERLMSVPGVGPVTSLRFVAALDDRTRFPNAHAVQGYLGLTRRELKLRAAATDRHHQGRAGSSAPSAGAGRLELPAAASARSHQPVGPADRAAPRQVHRDRRRGTQARWHSVRALARWLDLRAESPLAAALSLAPSCTYQTLPVSKTGQRAPTNGCPETVSAALALRASSNCWLRPRARDCTPSTDLHLCATSADSRLRQPVAWSTVGFQQPKSETRPGRQKRLSLTIPPPHSRHGGGRR
jgi:transposase